MTQLAIIITTTLSLLVIILTILAAAALYGAFGKGDLSKSIRRKAGPYGTFIAAFVAVGGTLGSLVYSEIMGFIPCSLCLIQRAFLYPQVIILGLAYWKKDVFTPTLSILLSVIGGIIALYHSYTQLGGSSLLPCTAEGADCSKVYFVEWGFITIPTMAFITFVAIIAFTLLELRNRKEIANTQVVPE